jgi:L-threonylcarbamoyladenylate synthase
MIENLSPNVLQQITKAADALRKGGIVAFPTDTIYGLGANIDNTQAVKKVFSVKKRPAKMALPILIDNIDQLTELVLEQNIYSKRLIEKFWPGGLTIIFRKAPDFNNPAISGGDKVGIRLPDHPVVRKLIRELGRPIIGTSANLHKGPATLTASEVMSVLAGKIDFIIDAGACPGGTESTIIDVTSEFPILIRPGIIPEKVILAELNNIGGPE